MSTLEEGRPRVLEQALHGKLSQAQAAALLEGIGAPDAAATSPRGPGQRQPGAPTAWSSVEPQTGPHAGQ